MSTACRLLIRMPRWTKFVALFMLTFAMFDVCSPEKCDAQLLGPNQSSVQILAPQNTSDSESCQFEEDCFNCAHYAPGTSFVLESTAIIAFTQTDLFIPSLDRPPLLPYHPPRA